MTITNVALDVAPGGSTSFTKSNGALTQGTILSDGTDSTYEYSSVVTNHTVLANTNPYTLPSGQYLYALRTRVRDAGVNTYVYTQLQDFTGGTAGATTATSNSWTVWRPNPGSAPVTVVNGWVAPPLTVAANWSSTGKVYNFQWQGTFANQGGSYRLYEADFDADSRDLPVVVVDGPSGSITDTSAAVIDFHLDAPTSIDPIQYYRVKLFDTATYSAPGFDPNTSPAAYDSGDAVQTISLAQAIDKISHTFYPQSGITYKAYVCLGYGNLGFGIQNNYVYPSNWAAGPTFVMVSPDVPKPILNASYSTSTFEATLALVAPLNMLDRDSSNLSVSIGGWATNGTNQGSIGLDSAQAWEGTTSLKWTLGTNATQTLQDMKSPVIASGKDYYMQCAVYSDTVTNNFSIGINYTDYKTPTTLVPLMSTPTVSIVGAWKIYTYAFTAPTVASGEVLAVPTIVGSVAGSGNVHYIDGVYLSRDISSWGTNTFSSGGYIKPVAYANPDAPTSTVWNIWGRTTNLSRIWQPYGSQGLVDPISLELTTKDVEVPFNALVQWVASVNIIYGDNILWGDITAPMPLGTPVDTSGQSGFVFRDFMTSPPTTLPVDVAGVNDVFRITSKAQQSVYYALGRKNPIMVRDVVNGAELQTVYFWVYSQAEKEAFVALREAQPVLLFQEAHTGEQWYVTFDSSIQIEEYNTTPTSYKITADLIEVDAPIVPSV